MKLKRVVITGMGAVTPLGHDVPSLMAGIEEGRSAVRYMEGWDQYLGMRSLVGAPAELKDEKKIPRQQRRSMGRMSIFAAQAAAQAVADAQITLSGAPGFRIGCAIGSTMGSAKSINDTFEIMLPKKDLSQLNSTMFFQCMSHTAAVNVAQYLGLNGYVLSTAAACASGLQAIGAGYDLIRLGKQDVMLCGGAEELHPTVTGSFDILFATSANFNKDPQRTPRPFDEDRDGLVCGEGSGVLVLEDRDRALARNAKIYAEIVGYSTNGNGVHMSQPNKDAMVRCMQDALQESGIPAGDVDYINAHATGTPQGDCEEAAAVRELFGDAVPISSLKGYLGHTLGASGAIELIASIGMMEQGTIYPTLNLERVDEACGGVRHVLKRERADVDVVLKNCFAFGGINATLVCRKHRSERG
ncbi:MAG: beta-ketoacyl synthase [Nitrospirae bacterium GWC2_57_13]|jgi:3-oxoacyl-[acyl-carrier-protein] synthase II|nr:MAG: beta-ketoacyl synthase [Nitrospirae bacterium GWC2_57_13]